MQIQLGQMYYKLIDLKSSWNSSILTILKNIKFIVIPYIKKSPNDLSQLLYTSKHKIHVLLQ